MTTALQAMQEQKTAATAQQHWNQEAAANGCIQAEARHHVADHQDQNHRDAGGEIPVEVVLNRQGAAGKAGIGAKQPLQKNQEGNDNQRPLADLRLHAKAKLVKTHPEGDDQAGIQASPRQRFRQLHSAWHGRILGALPSGVFLTVAGSGPH